MKKYIKDANCKVIILTARQQKSAPAIRKFLTKHQIDTKKVSVFGCNGSRNKADYLNKLIKRFNITESVLVFEDNLLNISDMISLEYEIPDLTFNFVQVIPMLLINVLGLYISLWLLERIRPKLPFMI